MSDGPLAAAKRGAYRAFGFLPRPFRRILIRTIRPSWTAGAVGIVERADGRWLFVKPVYRQGWTLPGGLVDRGEHPGATVVRELQEELGLTVTIDSIAWVVMDPFFNRLETVFRVRIDVDVDLEAIRVTTPELSDVGWFDPDAPPPVLEDETVDVLALARQIASGGPAVLIRPDRR